MPVIKFEPKQTKIKTILPGSKSVSNRLLIISAVGNFLPNFKNLSRCDDVKVMFDILHSNTNRFDVHDSGTALRFLTAYFAGIVGKWNISGSERIKQRPIKELVDVLLQMGAEISYDNKAGYAPITLTGTKMQGGEVELDISKSSQYASALLLISPMLEKGLKLRLKGQKRSMPYIDLTLELMSKFGVQAIQHEDEIAVMPNQSYVPSSFAVEADWSAAAFWFELAALNPHLSIKLLGLDKNSKQGDKAVAHIFQNLGIEANFGTNHLTLQGTKSPGAKPLNVDIRQTPDMFPAVALTAAAQKRPFTITGTANLAIKESHRIKAVEQIINALGVKMEIGEDEVTVQEYPNAFPGKIKVKAEGDHRIAMAAAPLSTIINQIEIDDPKVVSKSYPEFWEEMQKVGIFLA
ncbi:3-phosphoshikimate 1-carboxyvinyltransferase [Salinivirga cyanobacteriivorans]